MRKPRLEIQGGLYHIITRGNNRQLIFGSDDDYRKLLLQLAHQKARLPFYLYAYCLMPNHIHLLIERQDDSISRVMQRLLTAYSQYHNRKHRKSGHLLQGRYKAILCQSDQYLAELVRYIHLNPVRAKMVRRPQDFPYSSHRAYLGLDEAWLVDDLHRDWGQACNMQFALYISLLPKVNSMRDAQAETRNPGRALPHHHSRQ